MTHLWGRVRGRDSALLRPRGANCPGGVFFARVVLSANASGNLRDRCVRRSGNRLTIAVSEAQSRDLLLERNTSVDCERRS
jgi:hypothetical protein